jgi:DNA-binding transcriptional LysR family regulator
MDIRSILTIKTILSEGSFRKAAERLNYTQSAITFQVRQLERELSVQLFERVGRRMALTQAGREILPQMDIILQATQEMKDRVSGNHTYKGELRIGMAESLLTYKMQHVIKKFIEKAHKVKLFICNVNCYELEESVLNGSLDIGVHFNSDVYQKNIITIDLGKYPLSLVVSPSLHYHSRDFNTINQQKDMNFVINEPHSKYREIMENYLRERRILIRNTIELWSIESIKKSVASNLGFSLLPRFTVENELNDGSLVELSADISEKYITAVCTYHKNKWRSPAMELFLELLIKHQEQVFCPPSM